MKPKFILIVFICFTSLYAWALRPVAGYAESPNDATFPGYKTSTILTADGTQLHAWWLPTHSKYSRHITFIIAGGDAGNMSYWLPFAKALNTYGIDVYLFDYRGFGESQSFHIDPDQLYYNEFGEDLKAVVRTARKGNLGHGNKIALYAFSMGTIIAGRVWPDAPADYFIAEGFITNPVAVQGRIMRLKQKKVLLPDDAAKHVTRIGLAFPKRSLLFAGTADSVATVADCVQFKREGRPLTIIKTFNGGHGEGLSKMMLTSITGPYMTAILDYLSMK